MEKILKIFKQLKVNISLLDAIQHVPSYTKFMKDLCTHKRTLNVPKKVFQTDNVDSILTNSMPMKYKEPGCPTISCIIGKTVIDEALLDLDSVVNLLSMSYQQLELWELKPTRVMSDSSIKMPHGIVKDVLIKVEKFIFSVDFIVLET